MSARGMRMSEMISTAGSSSESVLPVVSLEVGGSGCLGGMGGRKRTGGCSWIGMRVGCLSHS